MMRVFKRCCLIAVFLIGALAITNVGRQRIVIQTPEKIYITPKIESKEYVKKRTKLYQHLMPEPIDHQEVFYNTIIENNIFAPLGYKPPIRTPNYRLIGTQIPYGREIEATAILQETTGQKRVHIANIGTKIDEETILMDIQEKQVILKKGKRRIPLKINTSIFLK